MYWYYKYPLLLILLVATLGLAKLLWNALPEKATGAVVNTFAGPFGDDDRAGGTDDGDHARTGERSDDDDAPPPPIRRSAKAASLLEAARRQVLSGNLVAARTLARNAMTAEGVIEFDRQWYDAAELVSNANTRLMNSSAPAPEKVAYTIQVGDALARIAYRKKTTVGALQRLNDSISRDSSRIYPGRVLFFMEADWNIRVVKSQFILMLNDGSDLYKLYHVAIGRENRTPVGSFQIYNKIVHPDWTHPTGRIIPYGDPENVLGTHWMAIKPTGATPAHLRGYGIHGTSDPDSIGDAASLGCIRLRNDDVAELFDFIPMPAGNAPGTPVAIEE